MVINSPEPGITLQIIQHWPAYGCSSSDILLFASNYNIHRSLPRFLFRAVGVIHMVGAAFQVI